MHNDFFVNTESRCIQSGEVLMKTTNRTWVHQPNPVGGSNSFTEKTIDADSIAKTQKLLDKAIAYAWYAVKSERRPPALTPIRWVWQLAAAYHSSCDTSQLMEEAAQGFAACGRKNLAQWAAQKVKDEAGHDRLALLDIESMGYDAQSVVQVLVPSAIKVLVDYFTQTVEAPDPIDCVGFSYVSERLGTFLGEEYIQSVQAFLPPGINATRWLRIHSGVGAEVKHIEETVKFVTQLTPQDQVRVAKVCYETALLRFSPPKEDYISDQELKHILKPLELPHKQELKSDYRD
ncbi:hypothetical protein [Brasilonema sp. UFV-L1]|uniref:hypothetical protein n=1 Tax=Brasilonema sp. UFV-L1 TaxID=2234130 RepID=UPI00145D5374|nr:hypothetical protein [Brasilonema sp. UFV-L1]NMG09119.1 hypothetical protein [Brasilonema sp. UFV-L1]